MLSKLPQVAREFSGDGAFVFCFERNKDLPPALFCREDPEGAECTSCWTPFVGARVRMTHASTASAWVAPRKKKEQKQEI